MVAHADEQSLVKVTCGHCQDTRMIAVAIATETEAQAPAIEVRDQPIDELVGPITTDDVLDARVALAGLEGDLAGLLRQASLSAAGNHRKQTAPALDRL